MIVGFDSVSIATSPPAPGVAQPRPTPIQPNVERQRSGQQGRQQNPNKDKGTEFRAALDAATSADAGLNSSQRFTATSDKAANVVEFVRPEKLPQQGPADISAADGADLYAEVRTQLNAAVKGLSETGPDVTLFSPTTQEFVQAASKYAERFFSVAGNLAKPGETLELKA
ncbi:MAG: hypothetical protein SFV19_12865 [Rhodospirillaceae bacterium]|nr:hypothetical protein [Rhodospirillaceae bacterium]